jgi:osmotically-inducible protein OsmY
VDQLLWDNRVDASGIGVEVNNGRTSLSGFMPTYFQFLTAENDVWLIPGVKQVINNMEVVYPESISRPSDMELKSKVADILSWTPNLTQSDIRVQVNNGWIILEGSVDAYWKKVHTEKLATKIKGVIGITNKLAVVPTKGILDETIAQTIVSALDRQSDIDIDSVDVEVEKGKVLLSGRMHNLAAFHKAYEADFLTAGVTKIQNDMAIA